MRGCRGSSEGLFGFFFFSDFYAGCGMYSELTGSPVIMQLQ
jgi:hypothetical protein